MYYLEDDIKIEEHNQRVKNEILKMTEDKFMNNVVLTDKLSKLYNFIFEEERYYCPSDLDMYERFCKNDGENDDCKQCWLIAYRDLINRLDVIVKVGNKYELYNKIGEIVAVTYNKKYIDTFHPDIEIIDYYKLVETVDEKMVEISHSLNTLDESFK